MNILFVTSIQCWGGAEVWLMDIMGGLAKKGHAVTLACRKNTPVETRARKLGFNVEAIRFGGDLDPFVIGRLRGIMKRKNIEVVCTNTEKDLRAGGIAGILAGVARVIPSREVDYPLKRTLSYRLSYKYLASRVIVNSRATQRSLLDSAPYLSPANIRLVYKGIDVSQFSANGDPSIIRKYGLSETAPVVSFVGRLDERKGLLELIEAWKSVHRWHPNAVLVIAGEGSMREDIERIIAGNNLSSSVIMYGFQSRIADLLAQSSLLVAPSWWEGFGYVLVEAMASRLPVVATNVSSIPEIVADGISGYLVEPKDARTLADAISRIIENPPAARRMGLAGRQIVERKFTLGRMVDEFEAAISDDSAVFGETRTTNILKLPVPTVASPKANPKGHRENMKIQG